MNSEHLRHILRAAAAVTGEKVFIVIGSQSIPGSHPDAPRSLRKSVEGDTSKLAAGRAKDFEYIRELLKHRLINRRKVLRLIKAEIQEELKQLLLRNWAIVISHRP
jgi:hypothetical protein